VRIADNVRFSFRKIDIDFVGSAIPRIENLDRCCARPPQRPGKWRCGKAPDCSYVEATQVEVQKSFW